MYTIIGFLGLILVVLFLVFAALRLDKKYYARSFWVFVVLSLLAVAMGYSLEGM